MKVPTIIGYWRGRYPKEYYYSIRYLSYGAGIYDLDSFLKRTLKVSLVITILITIITVFTLSTEGWILIKNVTNTIHFKLGLLKKSFFEKYKPLFVFTTGVLILLFLPPTLFKAITNTIISAKRSARAERIDSEMYLLVVALLGSAQSGLPQIECIGEILKSNLGREIKEELSKVYYAVKFEGKNLRSALIEVATTTPSKQLATFLRELAGIVESTPSFIQYLKNKLMTIEINETLNMDMYLSRINGIAQTYILTISLLGVGFTMGGILQFLSNVNIPPMQSTVLSAMLIILFTVMFALLAIKNAPEKYARRPYNKLAVGGISAITTGVFASIALKYILNTDLRLQILIATNILSIILTIFFIKIIKRDNSYNDELFLLLNKLSSLLESKTLSRALLTMNINEFNTLREHLRKIFIGVHTGQSIHKTLEKIKDEAPTFISNYIYSILSRASLYTHNLTTIVLHLISDIHNYNKFIVSRIKVVKQASTFLLISISLVTILFYMTCSIFNLIQFSSITTSQVVIPNYGLSEGYNDYTINTIMILSVTAPFIVCAVEYDLRKYFQHYTIYSSIAILIVTLITMKIFILKNIT